MQKAKLGTTLHLLNFCASVFNIPLLDCLFVCLLCSSYSISWPAISTTNIVELLDIKLSK